MTIIEQAQKIRQDMNTITAGLTDEQGLDLATLFMPWKINTAYAVGDRRRHNDKLYKCVQAHTSQADWTPDVTPALWTVVSVEEYPQWVQPTGGHDAYELGDKVIYENKVWVCTQADAGGKNSWAPGAYGWETEGG